MTIWQFLFWYLLANVAAIAGAWIALSLLVRLMRPPK